jgi:hypothetical protein
MEVTKCLKPSDSGHELVTVRVCRPQREGTPSKPDDVQADPAVESGKADMVGEFERRRRPSAAPG